MRATLILAIDKIAIFCIPAVVNIIIVSADYSAIQADINASAKDDIALERLISHVKNIGSSIHHILLGSLLLTNSDITNIIETNLEVSCTGSIAIENGEIIKDHYLARRHASERLQIAYKLNSIGDFLLIGYAIVKSHGPFKLGRLIWGGMSN